MVEPGTENKLSRAYAISYPEPAFLGAYVMMIRSGDSQKTKLRGGHFYPRTEERTQNLYFPRC